MPKERGENRAKHLSKKLRELLIHGRIDPEGVTFLAKGFHHTVLSYMNKGQRKVLKVPRAFKSAGIVHSAKEEQRNASVVSDTFGQHAVATQVHENPKGYFVEMDYVQGQPIHADMIDPRHPNYQPNLRNQLVQIVEANKQLLRTTGHFLDLTGAHALFDELQRPFGKERSRELANIIVHTDDKNQQTLRIIDNDLVPLRKGNPVERFKSLVVFMANYIVLARDFGLDIRPNKPTQRARRPR